MSAARDAAGEYDRQGARVIAVNPGSLESHNRWAEKFNFGFPICVDEDKKVAAAYGVVNMLGLTQRAVFLIDKQGMVAWAQEGMPSTDDILAALAIINQHKA